ncbi:sugar ABC transporter permease [Thermogymnomonas acidicola]|uniref:carbohydrate ABC transporter permease n=1 Tax=Thermogymnomonas acidicola TaxID=399579 RepID=UPI0013967BD7|nr:sugar ABC transporter permease [Thermogymnomonas acidicola]
MERCLVAGGNLLGILLGAFIFFVGNGRARTFFTSVFVYPPLAISSAAVAVIWTWLFNIHTGINVILAALHLPTGTWLDSRATMLPSLILVSLWEYSGLSALFYLASFQNINRNILESARLDAAGPPLRVTFRILLPNAKNGFIVSTALLFLFAFRIFSLAYVSVGLNPAIETAVLRMYYFYTTEFFSYSAASGVIIVVIAAVVVIPYALYGLKRWMANAS